MYTFDGTLVNIHLSRENEYGYTHVRLYTSIYVYWPDETLCVLFELEKKLRDLILRLRLQNYYSITILIKLLYITHLQKSVIFYRGKMSRMKYYFFISKTDSLNGPRHYQLCLDSTSPEPKPINRTSHQGRPFYIKRVGIKHRRLEISLWHMELITTVKENHYSTKTIENWLRPYFIW